MRPTFLLLYVITNEKTVKLMQIDSRSVAIRASETSPAEKRSNNSGRYTILKSHIPFVGELEQKGSQRVEQIREPNMCWAREENGRVPYSWKSVDGGCKYRESTGQTEVMLDGWCEGDLGQQTDDGAGCLTTTERQEGVDSLGAYVDYVFFATIFCVIPVFFGTALPHSCDLLPVEGWDAVT